VDHIIVLSETHLRRFLGSYARSAVDPERHIAVLNDSREEIFRVPVYSKPSISATQ